MEPDQNENLKPVTITIDPMQLELVTAEGQELVLKPEAEAALLQLLVWQQQIDLAIAHVKNGLEVAGLSYDPNFTSVQGDHVKINYQAAGAVYEYDPKQIRRYNEPFFSTRTTRAINSKAVAEFEERNKGRLPTGISRKNRSKNIVIRVAKGAK